MFSSLYRGSSKSGKQKPPQGPFAFLPCAVNLPALQFLTTSGSRGFFGLRALQPLCRYIAPAVQSARSRQRFLCAPGARAEPWRADGDSVQRGSAGPRRGRGVLQRPGCGESPHLLLTDYWLSPEAFRTATLRLVMELKKTTSRAYNAALLLPLFLLFWGKCLSSAPESYPATMQ